MKRELTCADNTITGKRSKSEGSTTDWEMSETAHPDVSKEASSASDAIPGEKEIAAIEYPTEYTVHYLTTEKAVNDVLRAVRDGVIGFDTEYKPRKPTADETFIENIFANVPGNKRSGLMVWQAFQLKDGGKFKICWDNIGLCVRHVALDANNVDAYRSTAFPKELERVLESHDIAKVGVGISADLPVIWNDLGCNINNAVECGLMAKLADPDRYKTSPFTNLSLQQSVSDVMGYIISKDLQKSNWKGDQNGDLSDEQMKYAAIDAHASLRLYEILAPLLEQKAKDIQKPIPNGWYTFNGKFGYTFRRELTVWDKDAPWSTADCTWFFGGKFQGYYP
ncbi:ribonuclease H-like domain-containing protein [Mycena vitilis]|nr:ribonuclease H-like domain-containing protein [Mycena vitilis]